MGTMDPLPTPDPARDYLAHASDLLTQTVFAVALGGSAFLAFCLLRFRWPTVYAPRMRLLFAAPALVGKTLLGWITMTLRAKDYDLLYSVGLDALLVLRLFRMLCALSVCLSVWGVVVAILKVVLAGDAPAWEKLPRAMLGWEKPLIVHFASAYVFTVLVYIYFARFAFEAVSLRWHYLLRVRNTRPARSVMLATEHRLKEHFEATVGRVTRVEIVPQLARLGSVVRRREHLLREIEQLIAAILGNPCDAPGYDRDQLLELLTAGGPDHEARQLLRAWSLPRFKTQRGARRLDGMLDALGDLLAKFNHADAVVDQVRQEWLASSGRRDRTPVAFVTFEDAASAHFAAQSFTCSQPFQLRTDLAPEPRDVFWDNIALPFPARLLRGTLSLLVYVLMLVYWLTISLLLSMLVSPETLESIIPKLPELVEKNKWLRGLFQYTTPTFMLSLMNSLVPYILNWLARVSGIQSRSRIQKSVLQRYFFFLIANVLLIFTVSRTILTDYRKWLENPAQIPRLFATNLPGAAPFFINYIILYGIGYYPIQLLQLGSISLAVFRRMVCRTPREFAQALRPNYIDWSFILPQPMLVFVIMATYSSLAPIVCVFAAVYFGIAFVVTKYLVYYVYAREFETAGEFIVPVLKMLAGSLWHYYCLIIGLCALNGAFGYVILLFPLLWANGYLLSSVSAQFYENAKFLPLDLWHRYQPGTAGNTSANDSHVSMLDRLQPPQLGDPLGSDEGPQWIRKQAHRLWSWVFSRIYINPEQTPAIIAHLDRSYSLSGPDIEHGLLLPQESLGHLSLDSAAPEESTPRFSTTFGGAEMRAELMLGRDQREGRIQADEFTDFAQSPVSLLQGVLDQGLCVYEHPYLVGNLPTLWLPMKR
ncbi:hypothetical protein BX070DRAFT_231107 [Coemansia spiralis]|nr:hypothetical protein BX070DRAFT_231107 [Coemansia spiralis]